MSGVAAQPRVEIQTGGRRSDLRRYRRLRIVGWMSAAISLAAILILCQECIWGMDYFLFGENASKEAVVRVVPSSLYVELTVFDQSSAVYQHEKNYSMFYHDRCEYFRPHPYLNSRYQIKMVTFLFFGRTQWVQFGNLHVTFYWLDVPDVLPTIAVGCALVGFVCWQKAGRSKHRSPGFPVVMR
jgi:hypothetical protein